LFTKKEESTHFKHKTQSKCSDLVARERFELSSAGPKPAMLDRYTTGLQHRLICILNARILRTDLFLISILACRENIGLKVWALRKIVLFITLSHPKIVFNENCISAN
jgi:hypothetical protein